jgi:uncharacterized membrane protein YccC
VAEASDVLASDAEREAAVARLREEAAAGRLDTAEFERRIDLAYRAQTRGELARLAADLPAPAPPTPAAASPWRSEAMRRQAAGFVTVNAVAIAIWLATGANGGFWPIWVLLVSGIGLFTLVVRTAFGVDPTAGSRRLERRERRRHRG